MRRWNDIDHAARSWLAELGWEDVEWSDGTLRPSVLLAILEEVRHGCRAVLECGGGASSVAIARAVAAYGGCLVTIEHDQAWAQRVEREIARAGNARSARVIHAPLAPHPLAQEGLHWYDPEVLAAELPDEAFELLLVDGPPAFEEGMGWARYPALPALADWLAPGALIVLDDIERPGEQAIAALWEAELGVALRGRDGTGGAAFGNGVTIASPWPS